MLFKVFTVLGAISLLGGIANCQNTASNQNEQVMKLLMSMMGSGTAGATKNDDNNNQLMQVLLNTITNSMGNNKQEDNNQMVQMLMKLMGNGADAVNNMNENQLMQLLVTSMMGSGMDISKLNMNQLSQLLTSAMGKGADSNKLNQNQLMQLMVMMMAGNGGDGSKLNENQMMQLLLAMMGGEKDSSKTNDNQMMQLLLTMMGGDKETPKNNDNQMMQLLLAMMGGAKETPKNNDNQIMQLLLAMMGGAKETPKNDNQLMQMLLSAIMANNKEEAKKPEGCMATQNMDKPVNPEIAAWIEMLKSDSMEDLFKQKADYTKFTEMVKYVEKNNKNDWMNQFMRQITDNEWVMNIGEQIVSMVENDDEVKESLVKFIEGNKEIHEFTVKAIKWMKMNKFETSTPLIQKIVRIFMDMDLKGLKVDEGWYDNYMSWVNCTFDKQPEVASIMKTIGMLSKADDMLMPYLQGLMQPKITITMQVTFDGKLRCNTPIQIVRQNLNNIYALTTTKKQLCGSSIQTFDTFQRASSVTSKMGTFIRVLGKANATPNMWKVHIKRENKVIAEDVDMGYIPKDGDTVLAVFSDQ